MHMLMGDLCKAAEIDDKCFRFHSFLTESNYTSYLIDSGSTNKLVGRLIHIWILINKQYLQYSLVSFVMIVPLEIELHVPFNLVMCVVCHRKADLHGTLTLHGIYVQVQMSLFGAVYLNSGVCLYLSSERITNKHTVNSNKSI